MPAPKFWNRDASTISLQLDWYSNPLNCEVPKYSYPQWTVSIFSSAHNGLACGLCSEIHFCHTVLCVWTNCAPIICNVDLLRTFWKSEPRPCFIVIIYSCNAKCLPVRKPVTSISLSATSSIMESVDLCRPSPPPRSRRANRYSVLVPRANGGHIG